jgi:molybdopterin synthase catalytic subunit
MAELFRVVDDTLDPAATFALVQDHACGAVATFVGCVRGTNDGKEVLFLEYEVQESMALKQFERLAAHLKERHAVHHVAIHHRRNRVDVGEPSVAIAISAPRRRDALAACAEAIERLKKDVPIWKKEVFPDGHRWVEGS